MEGDGILASCSNRVCESMCVCIGASCKQDITIHFAPLRSAVEVMLSGWRLAITLPVLVAEAGRNARLRFVASIQVKKLGEDNGKVGEGKEVGCTV